MMIEKFLSVTSKTSSMPRTSFWDYIQLSVLFKVHKHDKQLFRISCDCQSYFRVAYIYDIPGIKGSFALQVHCLFTVHVQILKKL